MPKTVHTPPAVRPYVFHGLSVENQESDSPKADCPFCGRDGRFGISNKSDDDGRFRCVACGVSGNAASFCEQLHAASTTATHDYSLIVNHRGLPEDALRAWGVCQSVVTREWVVPAYSASGKVCNLYRYVPVRKDGKTVWVLMQTPELSGGLFGLHLWDGARKAAWVNEGPWDGIATWDAFRKTGRDANVVATPGCGYFADSWLSLFGDKDVVLAYDNDYPRERDGKISPPAGWEGVKRACQKIAGSDPKPESVSFVAWDSGDAGYNPTTGGQGYTTSRKDGFDCRDLLSPRVVRAADGVARLEELVRPAPASWSEGAQKRGANRGDYVKTEACKSWKELDAAWGDAALWDDSLRGALVVLLSSVASVPGQGEQCWVKLISPPSTFKSKLCSAVATARSFVVEDDGMNGFFSGYNDAKAGEQVKDRSLVARLYGKTLITKEGATLIDSPMRDVIISQARTLYDGSASKTYNNKVRWEHHGLRFTWILSGTPSLRRLDASELGQRFIDYVIMDSIDPVHERKIIFSALAKQLQASQVTSNGCVESTVDSKYLRACKLTGGYVEHLRRIAPDAVKDVEVPKGALERIGRLASFIEYMRARPSDLEDDGSTRALGTRVGGQILKMAQYASIVVEKDAADAPSVWKVVEKVAKDTARGRTYQIATTLASHPKGLSSLDVARLTGEDPKKETPYLTFLVKLGAVESFDPHGRKNVAVAKYRLTKRFASLYREVGK